MFVRQKGGVEKKQNNLTENRYKDMLVNVPLVVRDSNQNTIFNVWPNLKFLRY